MGIFASLRRRKMFAWLGAYIAGGFLALEGVDQLVGYELLPELAYRIVLVFYLFGIPGTAILAWFHGERGQQEMSRLEMSLQGFLLVGAVAVSAVVVQNYRAAQAAQLDFTAEMGLDPRGIAVTYFEDLSPDGELAYAAEGLTEGLIETLSRVSGLQVVSQNGVARFQGSDASPDSIARALNVATVIEGSVEARGDRLRVTARLRDGLSGAEVADARRTFEIPIDQVTSARDSLTATIAGFLRTRLGEEVQLRETRRGTSSAEAWSLLQRASRLQDAAEERVPHGEFEAAIETFESADTLLARAARADENWSDPLSLRAHNSFRIARTLLGLHRGAEADAEIIEGIETANEALSRNPTDARALEARGNLRYLRYLWELAPEESDQLLRTAQADLERAVQIDPGLASAHASLAHMYYALKDIVKVVLAAQKAYEADAYLRNADFILDRLFWGHYDLEQFRDAQQWCREGYRRFPDDRRFTSCQLWLMLAPTVEPDVERARELRAQLDSVAGPDVREMENALAGMLVGATLARAGMPDSAEVVIEASRLPPEKDPGRELLGYEAVVRSVIGDTEQAIDLLQRYVAANPDHSFETGRGLHWWWRNLRDEPGFQAVRAIGH